MAIKSFYEALGGATDPVAFPQIRHLATMQQTPIVFVELMLLRLQSALAYDNERTLLYVTKMTSRMW